MSNQGAVEQEYIASIHRRLEEAILHGDFQQVRKIVESDHEENIRAAAGRLVSTGMTGERLSAGRQYIQGLLLEASNRRLAEALAAVGPTVAALNVGLDRVDGSIKNLDERSNQRLGEALNETGKKITFLAHGLDAVDGSIRKLDESSTELGWKALVIALVVGVFTLVQGIAAGIQIWKWMHGK